MLLYVIILTLCFNIGQFASIKKTDPCEICHFVTNALEKITDVLGGVIALPIDLIGIGLCQIFDKDDATICEMVVVGWTLSIGGEIDDAIDGLCHALKLCPKKSFLSVIAQF